MVEDIERVRLVTADGPICGYSEYKEERKNYCFKAIPYAKPPLGPLRFLPPSPIEPWTEEKDCTKDPPLPYMFHTNSYFGSEDCLYVRVVSPCLKPNKLLPVMFWMGSFLYVASPDKFFDPRLLVEEDVVFVLCGHRLGPLGFLSVNDHAAPGNAGLKDIVMALKWVQRNIKAFGGDPNNVTIFGNSSGGASVHFMLLSPMAAGLFHKAIVQSGSALNNWALTKNATQTTMQLAAELGIDAICKTEVVESLRTMSADSIMEATSRIWDRVTVDTMDHINPIFKPCIEDDLEGHQAFLSKSPDLIMKSGKFSKVPVIFGSVNLEAMLITLITQDFYKDFEQFNVNSRLLVPRALSGESHEGKNIGEQLIQFYMGDGVREDTKPQYLQLLSDYYYLYHVNKSVKYYKKMAPESAVYYYVLNHVGDWAVPSELSWVNSAGHGADIPNIFEITVDKEPCKGSRDAVRVRKKVVRMWTNFAKCGNPTPDDDDPILQITWDPVTSRDRLDYLNIGAELTKGRNPFRERMEFWDQLHAEHTFLRALVHFSELGVYI